MRRLVTAVLSAALFLGMLGCKQEPTASLQPSQSESEQTQFNTSLPASTPSASADSTAQPTAPPLLRPDDAPITDSSFVRVKDYIPDIVVELRYAGKNNFMGEAIYDFTDAYLRYGTVRKLMQVQSALKELGYGLKLWDAFRPAGAQHILWSCCQNETYIDNPALRYSSHTMGDTVDVTLVDASGNSVDMPSDYDVFTKQGDRDYSDCTVRQGENAALLEQLMKAQGFSGYSEEWWHYSDSATYATDLYFNPAVVSLWYADCNSYLSLRKNPSQDSQELTRVPADASVILLGWCEKFAYVEYSGVLGFVSSQYLKPDSWYIPNDMLTVVRETGIYTYDQMQSDIAALQQKYPAQLKVSSIGTSELGRDLTLLILGDPNAAHHVIIHGAIHAREHMTAWMVMAMTDYWLSQSLRGMEDTCFHIVPMVNPDGVYLAQSADFTAQQTAIYQWDKSMGYTSLSANAYAAAWKANGLGVDLNRNFDAAWKTTSSRSKPSTERYKGTAPVSAAETAALASYTLALMPDVTISCHSTGSVIYYEYGKKPGVNAASKSLGKAVSAANGYRMVGAAGLDAGGYKDWCMDVLEIPSLTIEMGCDACPLPKRELYSIFARNLRLMPTICRWIRLQA